MPKVVPKTVLYPLGGVGEFDDDGDGVNNIYRYMFKNKETCLTNFYMGKRPSEFRRRFSMC